MPSANEIVSARPMRFLVQRHDHHAGVALTLAVPTTATNVTCLPRQAGSTHRQVATSDLRASSPGRLEKQTVTTRVSRRWPGSWVAHS
jgi:hypothetical protein